ncbi:MAG TPA: CHAT domain-containing protein [Candidatus Sulfotelmatobacter sp.]|nr:CHAT domain-containing protein [Candidatus Sulfotelmatobacter sp.]
MTDSISARQRILKQFWNSNGPNDVLDTMAREAGARNIDLIAELQKEATACAPLNPELASRLTQIANTVQQVHTSINRFAGISGINDLLSIHSDFPFCWTARFNRLLGAFWSDALRGSDNKRKEALRRALRFLRDLYVTVHSIKELSRGDAESWTTQIEHNPLLCEEGFHKFLDQRGHFAASIGDRSAELFSEIASYMRMCCKTVSAIKRLQERTSTDEDVLLRLPLSPDRAELWFIVTVEFSKEMVKIAEEVNRGTQTLEAALEAAVRAGPKDEGDSDWTDTFYAAAFLEHLLRVASPEIAARAIVRYRKLMDTGHWNSQESRATFVLRYSKALLEHWRVLEEPLWHLEDATDLIGNALTVIKEEVSPRLMRDLLFARARHLENIGNWQPSAYELAVEDYSRGLAVSKVAHELEARGAALTDYANTLTKIPQPDAEENDRKIIATYEEALITLSSPERTVSRSLALNSYAAYLNDRLQGDRSINQERALSMAQQAIDLIERAIASEDFDRNNNHTLRALASAYLTKSNVVRKRDVGDDYEANLTARDILRTAVDQLGKAHDDQLRGILYLNLGQVNVELYSISGDLAHAQSADYAYSEAKQLLGPYPRDFSHAVLADAMLVAEIPDSRTPEALEKSLAAARAAISFLEAANDPESLARAWFCLGELQFLGSKKKDYESAVDSFGRSQGMFLQVGNLIGAIATSRRGAAAWVEQFRQHGSIDSVRQAKDLLARATQWVDKLWEQIDSVEWRYTVSDRFSNVYAEMAWCQAVLEDTTDAIAFSVVRAKGRELTAHIREVQSASQVGEGLSDYLDQLRMESRLAETTRWRIQRQAQPDKSIDDTVQLAQKAVHELGVRRRLLDPRLSHGEGSPASAIPETFLKSNPAALICDITTCRWGSVVMLFGGSETGKLAAVSIRVLELETTTVQKWVRAWSAAYVTYLEARGAERTFARRKWADQTDELLQSLSAYLVKPALAGLDDAGLTIELIIAPGQLAGLPIHAAPLLGGRCAAEIVGSVAYVPNIAVLSAKQEDYSLPSKVLCVLSDPKADLPLAATEIISAADTFQKCGAEVTVFSVVGRALGTAALDQRKVRVGQGVKVLNDAPTLEQLRYHLPSCEYFFYSGHGTRRGGQSGLVLVDENGHEKLLGQEDILAMPALRRRPMIMLSACETASSGSLSAELFDVSSTFLRIGARFVIGTLWVVVEDCAKAFTAEFHSALASGNNPSSAFGMALRALKTQREASGDSLAVHPGHPIYWAPFMGMRGG